MNGFLEDQGNSTLNWWSMMAAITARMIIFKLHLVLIAETKFMISLIKLCVCSFPTENQLKINLTQKLDLATSEEFSHVSTHTK